MTGPEPFPQQLWQNRSLGKMCCSGNMIPKLTVCLVAVNDNILRTLNYEVTVFHIADMQLTQHLMVVVMVTPLVLVLSSSVIFGCEGVLGLTYPTTEPTDQSIWTGCDMRPLDICVSHNIMHGHPHLLIVKSWLLSPFCSHIYRTAYSMTTFK